MSNTTLHMLFAALACLFVGACLPSDSGTDSCTQGRAVSCPCGDGSGIQTCLSDGTFGPCQCGDAGDVMDTADDRDATTQDMGGDASQTDSDAAEQGYCTGTTRVQCSGEAGQRDIWRVEECYAYEGAAVTWEQRELIEDCSWGCIGSDISQPECQPCDPATATETYYCDGGTRWRRSCSTGEETELEACEFGCADGECVTQDECTPDCSGLSCGEDPICGKSCGQCGTRQTCNSGQCVSADTWTEWLVDGQTVVTSTGGEGYYDASSDTVSVFLPHWGRNVQLFVRNSQTVTSGSITCADAASSGDISMTLNTTDNGWAGLDNLPAEWKGLIYTGAECDPASGDDEILRWDFQVDSVTTNQMTGSFDIYISGVGPRAASTLRVRGEIQQSLQTQ